MRVKNSLFGDMLRPVPHAPTFNPGVRCMATGEVAVPDKGCGHRIHLWLGSGEPLLCKGPGCPRFPKELRKAVRRV